MQARRHDVAYSRPRLPAMRPKLACYNTRKEFPHALCEHKQSSGHRAIARLEGRYFHSPNMPFAHYDFTRGSSIHELLHAQEEVYEVIDGELEVTIDGVAQLARA